LKTTAVKRQREPQRIVGDLLSAEINEKQARSIKYQLTIAKLPLAKDLPASQRLRWPRSRSLSLDDQTTDSRIVRFRTSSFVSTTSL
jgi:hypothetical protein